MSKLIFIMGDQLSHEIAGLREGEVERDCVVMCEVIAETTYVPHHQKKMILILSAMRHFAEELRQRGWKVIYYKLDDHSFSDFSDAVRKAASEISPSEIITTHAGEWRVQEIIEGWSAQFDLPVRILEDERFIATPDAFQNWAEGRKQLRMEYFYREMRRKSELLMDGDKPMGGKWNYDSANRKPPAKDLQFPPQKHFDPDLITQDVISLIEERFPDHMGDGAGFSYAVTEGEAEEVLDHFITYGLAHFGDYQDAMVSNEPFLYHSLISAYLNMGLLDPLVTCQKIEQAFIESPEKYPLNCVEGFIRQVIGWREYVRGIYWLKMPDYAHQNFLEADRPLPDFYWTGETDLNCLSQAIGQTITHGYAHHIQRLMITGNFALLTGIKPQDVHHWYLSVYVDAFEWVELPNTLGMSQFSDGGYLGSKPYISSGKYISKMSDYCRHCHYNVNDRTSDKSCPFNSLYWNFIDRHQDRLAKNPRMGHAYRTWQKMNEADKSALINRANSFLKNLK